MCFEHTTSYALLNSPAEPSDHFNNSSQVSKASTFRNDHANGQPILTDIPRKPILMHYRIDQYHRTVQTHLDGPAGHSG